MRSWAGQVHALALDDTAERMRRLAPVGKGTGDRPGGATRDSIRVGAPSSGGDQIVGTVEAPTPQARYTDEGTDPHPITSHGFDRFGRGVLSDGPGGSFYVSGPVGGSVTVNHPGYTGTGWWSDVIGQEWQEALRDAAGSVSF